LLRAVYSIILLTSKLILRLASCAFWIATSIIAGLKSIPVILLVEFFSRIGKIPVPHPKSKILLPFKKSAIHK